MTTPLLTTLSKQPYVAILRGLGANEAVNVGSILYEAGFRAIEVPLNRPEALLAIEALSDRFNGAECLIGAGTVIRKADFSRARSAGAKFFLSPHTDRELLDEANRLDVDYVPGCATPTDAITATNSGRKILKIFPYNSLGDEFVNSLRGILKENTTLMAVGGIDHRIAEKIMPALVNFIGTGSALYSPQMSLSEIQISAQKWFTKSSP